ncbi:MAG: putative transposase, partial [Candidatus Omnitrophota bacterium]
GSFTTKLNASRLRDGHLFRGRFKSVLIEEEVYLRNAIRYIHLNPVKAKLTKDPYTWQYSSHKAIVDSFNDPLEALVSTNYVKQLFSDDLETYRGFHQAGVDEHTNEFYNNKKLAPIFGSEDFIQEIKERIELNDGEIEFYKQYNQDKLLPIILETISHAFLVSYQDIYSARKGRFNYARSMAIMLTKELTNMTYADIATSLKQKSANAVKDSVYQLKKNFKESPDMLNLYTGLKTATSHLTT